MSESTEPEQFEDINETVRAEWVEETTPYERIRAVVSRTDSPTAATKLAEEAATSPKTARKHLATLAEDGFVSTESGDHGATLYRRSSESLVVEQAAQILSELSTDELRKRIEEMREQIRSYQETYSVESPEAATVDRTNDFLGDATNTTTELDPETLREWQTTRRNLAFANAALSIANAQEFVEADASGEQITSP